MLKLIQRCSLMDEYVQEFMMNIIIQYTQVHMYMHVWALLVSETLSIQMCQQTKTFHCL